MVSMSLDQLISVEARRTWSRMPARREAAMGHWRVAEVAPDLPPSTLADRSDVRNMRECNGEQGAGCDVVDFGWMELEAQKRSG